MPFDDLDRALVHALHVDGRAPFSQVAAVLGVSQQTVARRYRRMRAAGALRVVGLTDPRRLGEIEWFVRLRCTPDVAVKVAEALARRTDTSWVKITSGGAEIVCITRVPGGRTPGELLLQQLPRTPRVVAVSAHCLLRTFVGGPVGWPGRADALTAEQIAQLAPREPVDAEPVDFDGNERLLELLQQDGRTAFADLAERTGMPEATARRRVDQLLRSGALYLDIDLDPAALGYHAQALLWFSVPPDRLTSVAESLAEQREVAFAAVTTGETNLFANVVCRDVDALYAYLTEDIASIGGIGHVETTPVIRTVKRAVPPLAG